MKRKHIRILIGAVVLSAILFGLTLPGPRLSYVGTQPKDRYGTILLKYELRNRGFWPIYYEGYGPGMPIYRVSYRSGDEWHEHPLGWCGTGVQPRRLAPWETVLFDVNAASVDTSRVFRVGFSYYRTTWRFPHYLILWLFNTDLDGKVWSRGQE